MVTPDLNKQRKIIAILQARTSSSRLPGKVLKIINSQPMLALQIKRLSTIENIDQLVLATSEHPSDNEIAELAQSLNIPCFRGNLNDVLDRFYQCAKKFQATDIVRFTGDCPLIDPTVSKRVIEAHCQNNADYTSNCLPPTFPDGLDTEVFTFTALETAATRAKLQHQREHVTPYITDSGLFKLSNVTHFSDLSHLRWTVDNPEDFQFVSEVFGAFKQSEAEFNFTDILSLLEKRPELCTLNNHISRNEGYQIKD